MSKVGVRWTRADDELLRKMALTDSHADIAALIGRTEGSVRNRCWRLGLVDKSDEWTQGQINKLIAAYESAQYDYEINLTELASGLGKHKSNVSRKARSIGLTNISRRRVPLELQKIKKPKYKNQEERGKALAERMKLQFALHGHPRGALGMKHSDEAKAVMSIRSKARADAMSAEEKSKVARKALATKYAKGTMQTMNRANATWGAAWRVIGGVRKYFRSKWEANYARYLQWLLERGEISKWEHEPEVFWFDGIKRGCVSYLPDFRVTEASGAVVYHEVKGWMDDRSKTKIKRMAKYHPSVKLIVIDSKGYAAIKKVMQSLIPDWETDSKGR